VEVSGKMHKISPEFLITDFLVILLSFNVGANFRNNRVISATFFLLLLIVEIPRCPFSSSLVIILEISIAVPLLVLGYFVIKQLAKDIQNSLDKK